VARLLDSAIPVPGTSFRIGLDPILGLIPGLGDLVSPIFAIVILWQARAMAVPRVVQLRMLFNVAIDAVVGAIPLIGDLFDFAWNANNMNVALLERHARAGRRASAGDWAFVILMTLLIVAIAAIPLLMIGWALSAIGRRIF
jgi:hypothetical protein